LLATAFGVEGGNEGDFLPAEQALDERLPSRTTVRGDVAEDASERADSEGRLTRDGDVMLTTFTGRQTLPVWRVTR